MSREAESSPGFTGNPLVSMPRARDSGDPEFTSHNGGSDAAFRLVNGVGIAMWAISELILTACLLTVYASHPPVTRRMATLVTDLPATALARLDLHQLDFTKRFR
jgi:hypothetical protein